MNRKLSSVSLSCSQPTPQATLPSRDTPNTPEILNTIISITKQIGPQWSQQENQSFRNARISSSVFPFKSDTYSSTSSPWSSFSFATASQRKSKKIKDGLMMKVKKNLKMDPEDSLLFDNIKREVEVNKNSYLS